MMDLCAGGPPVRMVWIMAHHGIATAGKPKSGFCGNGNGLLVDKMVNSGIAHGGGRHNGESTYLYETKK